ncbi:meiosis protein SPO22/ZIP4 like-domain-containing protein [Lipomyces japonicus]|uniref:meiosis protein SPO22/ZIP4 like-domain-containing protein n=1 Tax=Lipomyces japonicus TaxID=56871 RepID=UPI0034CE10F4
MPSSTTIEKRYAEIRDQAQALLDDIKQAGATWRTDGHQIRIQALALSSTAEQFIATFLKSKQQQSRVELDSSLDRIATELWNQSTICIRQLADAADVAAGDSARIARVGMMTVRATACVLIECCQKLSPSTAGVEMRAIKCYFKSIKLCLDYDDVSLATSLTDRVGKLLNLTDGISDGDTRLSNQQDYMAQCEFQILRVFLAWKHKNRILMTNMIERMPLVSTQFAIPARKVAPMVEILIEIGTEHDRDGDHVAAQIWFQHALELFDRISFDEEVQETTIELKFDVMRNYVKSLARSSKYDKADAILLSMEEQFPTTIWFLMLKFDLLMIRNGSPESMLELIMQMIFLGVLSDTSFRVIMAKIQTLLRINKGVACKALDYLLTKKLALDGRHEWLQQAFVTRIEAMVSPNDQKSEDSIIALSKLFSEMEKLISQSLSTSTVHAAQILLWRAGESFFASDKFADALAWFKLCMHNLFENSGELNIAKICRKIMLCEFHIEEYGAVRATYATMMAKSAQQAPLTQYILFKAAMAMQDEDAALNCLQAIADSDVGDARMLSACAMEAQEKASKRVTLAAMKHVLDKIDRLDMAAGLTSITARADVHVATMLRCVIRLQSAEFDRISVAQRQDTDADAVYHYFSKAYSLAKGSIRAGNLKMFDMAECEWFTRSSYNFALKLCLQHNDAGSRSITPEAAVKVSNVCMKFMELYRSAVVATATAVSSGDEKLVAGVTWQAVLVTMLCASAATWAARHNGGSDHDKVAYHNVRKHVEAFKQACQEYRYHNISNDDNSHDDDNYDLTIKTIAMLTCEFEAAAGLQAWAELPGLTEEILRLRPGIEVYEHLVDIVLTFECPTDDSLTVLGLIVSATMRMDENDANAMTKLARWVRVIVNVSLPRRASVAEQVVTQMRAAMNRTTAAMVPTEEIHWLATTCWNFGIDLYAAADVQGCKRWCEVAITLATHVSEQLQSTMQTNYLKICGATTMGL